MRLPHRKPARSHPRFLGPPEDILQIDHIIEHSETPRRAQTRPTR